MANKIEVNVEKIVEELLQGQSEIELVDVEYVRERDWYLRVFIDREEGIEIDDCQRLSERLSEILDQRDLIPDSYILEVSSPGLDRVLRKEKDFVRECGKKVDITFYAPVNGEKQTVGILAGYDGKNLLLDGQEPLPMEKISLVRLHIDF